jgi:ankyrin repeat protein
MIKLLISLGAEVDSVDEKGCTPLYYAIKKESIEICECLIQAGANYDFKDTQLRTPLYFASSLYKLINYFLDKGADVNARTRLGRTALIKACWNGQYETTRCLLKCSKVMHAIPE